MDNELSLITTFNTLSAIYNVMFTVYCLTALSHNRDVQNFSQSIIFGCITIVMEFIINCLICGSVEERTENLYEILHDIPVNDLSDYEYKQWIIFSNIVSKPRIGFTIGGFARLNKTTLIAVCIHLL